MQCHALNIKKIVKKFPQTPLTFKIANSRSNFISNINYVLKMKFDLEMPIFKVNNVSRNFKTIFYAFKTSNFA